MTAMESPNAIEKLKNKLKFNIALDSSLSQANTRKQLAAMYLQKGDVIEAIYSLTESHGIELRNIVGSLQNISQNKLSKFYEFVSFKNIYTAKEVNGMLVGLKEMPHEWTIVQITTAYNNNIDYRITKENKNNSPQSLRKFYITRLPCGKNLNFECPIIVERLWPKYGKDLVKKFWKIKEKFNRIMEKNDYNEIIKFSTRLTRNCKKLNVICLKQWLVLFLGTMCDSKLSKNIRKEVDKVLYKNGITVSRRQRYMTYLLAEGVADINQKYLRDALFELYPTMDVIQKELLNMMTDLGKTINGLDKVKRNPVILIIEDHLDHIPWESIEPFQRHPYSRMPSLHFVHALFLVHRKHIKFGLREISKSKQNFVINHKNANLYNYEQNLAEFLKKRFPDGNVVDNKISEEIFTEIATKSNNIFVNSGHGNGIQLLPMRCKSDALIDNVDDKEMYGDFLQFLIAGSPCILGMLWSISIPECVRMWKKLLTICLDEGDYYNKKRDGLNIIGKEPDLLRALCLVKKDVHSISNGAAFIARGIPIKLKIPPKKYGEKKKIKKKKKIINSSVDNTNHKNTMIL